MPLVTTKEMFRKAYDGGYAIGAFNVNNMEIVQGITEACAMEKAPVILQVSKGARAACSFGSSRNSSESFRRGNISNNAAISAACIVLSTSRRVVYFLSSKNFSIASLMISRSFAISASSFLKIKTEAGARTASGQTGRGAAARGLCPRLLRPFPVPVLLPASIFFTSTHVFYVKNPMTAGVMGFIVFQGNCTV